MRGHVTIRTATPAEWSAAFNLALKHLGDDVRSGRVITAVALVAAGDINPDGIIVAWDGAQLCGVQVSVPLPGAGGLLWLPKTEPVDIALEERLVRRALEWLHGEGAKLAQALLSPLDVPDAEALVRCGFKAVTRLQYLEHYLESLPPPEPSRLRLYTYKESKRDVFHATLVRTYEQTLDCPELNDTRTLDEIIAGHMGQGQFRPERWWLAVADDQPVGVVLATEVPDLGAWDLSYLGVVPEARRHGVGRELTEHVLRVAQASYAPRLIVAVDERNHPALQLYRRLGFVSVEFREVYLNLGNLSLAADTRKSDRTDLT